MDAVAVVGLEPDLHRRHRGDRAGQTHQRAGTRDRRDLAHHVVEVGVAEADAGRELLGLRRIVLDELLGEPHAAHVDRHHPLDPVGADDQLGRPAADVDDQERPGPRVETAGGAPERQAPLLLAAQQPRAGADHVLDGGEELVAVYRVPRRRGGRGPHPVDPVLVEHLAIAAQAVERALDRLGSEATRRAHALAQPGDRVAPVEDVELAVDRPPHQQAGRVGADVHGGDRRHVCRSYRGSPSVRRSGGLPRSRSSTHRPTGSSPPTRNQA